MISPVSTLLLRAFASPHGHARHRNRCITFGRVPAPRRGVTQLDLGGHKNRSQCCFTSVSIPSPEVAVRADVEAGRKDASKRGGCLSMLSCLCMADSRSLPPDRSLGACHSGRSHPHAIHRCYTLLNKLAAAERAQLYTRLSALAGMFKRRRAASYMPLRLLRHRKRYIAPSRRLGASTCLAFRTRSPSGPMIPNTRAMCALSNCSVRCQTRRQTTRTFGLKERWPTYLRATRNPCAQVCLKLGSSS